MRLFGNGCFVPELNGDVCPLSHFYSWEFVNCKGRAPLQRHQHVICLSGRNLYMYGGRSANGTQSDFWKYELDTGCWSVIDAVGDVPPPLEGHTIVEFEGQLYMFGGEMCFISPKDVPLWVYNPKLSTWNKRQHCDKTPIGRREHVAVIYQNDMYIHGGYIDLKGPTGSMWKYSFRKKKWNMVKAVSSGNGPLPRYKHAAIVYDDIMWMCGGLMGITAKNETQVWTWDFFTSSWSQIRTKCVPYQLFNHSVSLVDSDVYVFGGNQENGQPCSHLWKVSMKAVYGRYAQTWHKCLCKDKVTPLPSTNHCLVLLPDFQLNDLIVADHSPTMEDVVKFESLPTKPEEENSDDNRFSCGLKSLTITNYLDQKGLTFIDSKSYTKTESSDSLSEDKFEQNKAIDLYLNSAQNVSTDSNGTHQYHVHHDSKQCLLNETTKNGRNTRKTASSNYANEIIDKNVACLEVVSGINDDPFLHCKEKCSLLGFNVDHNEITHNTKSVTTTPNRLSFGDSLLPGYSYQHEKQSSNLSNCSDPDYAHVNPAFLDSPHRSLHEEDLVHKFSYNLSQVPKTWHPLKTEKRTFQTTSFIEVSKSSEKKWNESLQKKENLAKEAVVYDKGTANDSVTLPDIFLENAKILNQLEETNNVTPNFNNHQKLSKRVFSLLLIGGKEGVSNIHVHKPINIWQCELHYNL
ncbi:unnamed protein product [Clavelina lepadiformis]|uniref:Uncharacterized protein n=1 Tax=Clavelina lepadiformis TaxID=159417 RepID=A0ABP0FXK1_CLALP